MVFYVLGALIYKSMWYFMCWGFDIQIDAVFHMFLGFNYSSMWYVIGIWFVITQCGVS